MRSAPPPFERRGPLDRVFSLRIAWWRVDWHILAIALALLGFGLFVVRAIALSDEEFGRLQPVSFASHLQKVFVAAPMLIGGLLVKPRWLRRNAWLIYGATIVLLLLVPVFGEMRNNARRWIPLPGIGFDLQPSELAKIGVVIALARVLYTSRLTRWSDWRMPVAVALLPMGLVVLQPDLGTAMTIVPVCVGMFYVAGAPARRIVSILLGVVVVGVLAYQFELIRDYQLQRIDTWLHSMSPQSLIGERNGSAYHTYHARVAIGNGGWWGTGLGAGVGNEAGLVPERSCDSVFAIVAEEAGFFGASGIVVLYSLFIVLVLWSASSIRERFSRLVVCGIGLHFAAHAFVNIGVNLGLVPMTGLPLPLLSTGGSSMLATFAAVGLALGLAAQREATLDEDAFRE